MSWTDDLAQKAKAMWVDGASAKVICETISTQQNHITRNAVIGKLTRMGVMGDGGTHQKRPIKVSAAGRVPKVKRKRGAKPLQTRRYERNSTLCAPTPLPVEEPATEVAVLWLKMGYHQCRWPMNDVNPIERHIVCGATAPDARSYCEFHAQLSVGPGARGERNAVPELL